MRRWLILPAALPLLGGLAAPGLIGVHAEQRYLEAVARLQDAVDSARDTFEYVSFLPFAWIGEQQFGVYWPLYKAFAVNFPEKVETVQENIREIGPHILLAPPRIWEKICSDIQVKIQEAVWIKRYVYQTFLPVGYRMADDTLEEIFRLFPELRYDPSLYGSTARTVLKNHEVAVLNAIAA